MLATLGEEWRSKWLLEKRWQSASTEELIRGMNDINDHVRLAAVAACNKAAELRQRKRAEPSFGKKQLEYETCDLASLHFTRTSLLTQNLGGNLMKLLFSCMMR